MYSSGINASTTEKNWRKVNAMIPGNYSICHAAGDGDSIDFLTLSWGYDSANDAFHSLEKIARENGISPNECAVIRIIDREDADEFDH